MSLLILSHLPSSDPSFYHVWKSLGVDPRDGECEGVECWQPTTQAQSEARTLLVLGGEALQASMGLTNIAEVAGAVWNVDEARAIAHSLKAGSLLERLPNLKSVVVSLHPVDAIRGARWMLPTIYRFVRRAAWWSQQEDGPRERLKGMNINLNPTGDDIEEAFAQDDGGPISIDIETPKGRQGEILLVGIAPTSKRAVVVDWGNSALSELTKRLLLHSRVGIVGHNFYYDHRGFSLNNITFPRETIIHDTITQASCIYPPVADRKTESRGGGDSEGGGKKKKLKIKWLGLQNCVLRENEDEAPWKRVGELRWVQEFYRVAYPEYSEWKWEALYCSLDVLKTRRLHDLQCRRMQNL